MGSGASKGSQENANGVKVNEEALKVANRQNELIAKQEEQIQKAKEARMKLEQAQQQQKEQDQAEAKVRQEEKIRKENRIQQEKFKMALDTQENKAKVQVQKISEQEAMPTLTRDQQVDRLLSMTPIKENRTNTKLQGLNNNNDQPKQLAPLDIQRDNRTAMMQAQEVQNNKVIQNGQNSLQLDCKSSEGNMNPQSPNLVSSRNTSQVPSKLDSNFQDPSSKPHIVDSEAASDAEENKEETENQDPQQDDRKRRLEVKMALDQNVNRLDKSRIQKSQVDIRTEPTDIMKPSLENCKVNQVSYTNLGIESELKFDIKPITTKSVKPKNDDYVMNGLVSNRELEIECEENRNIDMNELKNLLTQC